MGNALHTPGTPGVGAVSPAEARLDDAGLIAVQGATLLDVRTGVMAGPGSTALVTGTASTAPMRYSIAVHHWVTSRGVTSDGVYRGAAEATKLVDTTAAPGSGSRIDVIYEKQNDANSTISPDGSTAPVYGVVQGTPSTGIPAKPAIPVGAIELATATVSAGATATNGAGVTITNTARQTVARGARVPCRDQADEDSLTKYAGLEIYRLDTGQVKVSNGTTFTVTYDPAFSVLTAPRGRIVSSSFIADGPAAIAGTETLFDATTFTAVAGRRYRLTWDGAWVVNTAQVTGIFTVRTKAGASVDNTGALHYSRYVRAWAFGEFLDKQIVAELSGLAAGQTTVGIGARVAIGGGTIRIPGAADNIRRIIVEDIGT